jgi:membrane-associated protease RseP (regulator of RpoE activity)
VLYAIGVIVFAVGLLASIALHEIGHMVPAKRFGVKVTQYMVGFGPTLWSRKRGDTEYGIKAIPAGGYIRMIGMIPPRQSGNPSRWPRRLATAVEEFRRASRSEVGSDADEPRQFYRLTPGKKIIVMLGGPSMNFVIYVVLTILLFGALGQLRQDSTTTISSVVQCVVPANSPAANSTACPAGAQTAPAAGVLRPGDQLLAINGLPVQNWNDAVAVIEASPNKTLSMQISRNGTPQTVEITPVKNTKYVSATSNATKVAGFIGVSPTIHSFYQRDSLVQIPGQIVSQLAQGLRAITDYPSKIHSLWQTVFEGKARDPNGAVGVVGLSEIGGQIASAHHITLRDKMFDLVSLLASVNLLLFLFNLLPLLPLDGGHVAGALVEAVKRGGARLRFRAMAATADPRDADVIAAEPSDRPEGRPIYVDTAQMLPVMYGIASVLLLLTLLVVYADIVKPIHLGG